MRSRSDLQQLIFEVTYAQVQVLNRSQQRQVLLIGQQPLRALLKPAHSIIDGHINEHTAGDRRDRLAWIPRLHRDALHGYDRADLARAARAGFWSVWRMAVGIAVWQHKPH